MNFEIKLLSGFVYSFSNNNLHVVNDLFSTGDKKLKNRIVLRILPKSQIWKSVFTNKDKT